MKIFLALQRWLGGFFLLTFFATGFYLRRHGALLEDAAGGVRMMFRSSHVYLLFVSLLNLLAGSERGEVHLRRLEVLGRLPLMVAPLGLLIAFFVEPPIYAIDRPITFWCVVACFSGVLLMLEGRWEKFARLSSIGRRSKLAPVIRSARAEDMPRMQQIRAAAFAPIFEGFERALGSELYALVQAKEDGAQGRLLEEIAREDSLWELLAVEVDTEIVGFVSFRMNEDSLVGEIGLNGVHPDSAGRGIGAFMYRHVLSAMKARGMKAATVATGADGPHEAARRAYSSAGFRAGTPAVWLCRLL